MMLFLGFMKKLSNLLQILKFKKQFQQVLLLIFLNKMELIIKRQFKQKWIVEQRLKKNKIDYSLKNKKKKD